MFKLIPLVLLGGFVCAGQTTYVFVSLTGNDTHRFASAKQMNAAGAAIGTVDADSKAVVFDPVRGTIYPTSVRSLSGINASGDIIGVTFEGQQFVAAPPYTTYLKLPDGYSIDAINDRGDMVGSPLSSTDWFPNLYIQGAVAINNARQVLAYGYMSPPLSSPLCPPLCPPIGYFLYTPGKGDILVPSNPTALNNNGDLLYGAFPGNVLPEEPQYIQTASGQIPLPPGYQWTGFNDNEEVVGYSVTVSPLNVATVTPVYYSVATGLVDLSTRFQNTHALVDVLPVTVNNNGEILVDFQWTPFPGLPVAPSAGVGLLVPQRSPVPDSAPSTAARVTRARNYSINGVRAAVTPQGR